MTTTAALPLEKGHGALSTTSVTVRAQSGDSEVITTDAFRAWKRRRGKHAAFVVQSPVEYLVHTYADMQKLPVGEYEAVFVKKCALPEAVKKDMRGTDLWKCV